MGNGGITQLFSLCVEISFIFFLQSVDKSLGSLSFSLWCPMFSTLLGALEALCVCTWTSLKCDLEKWGCVDSLLVFELLSDLFLLTDRPSCSGPSWLACVAEHSVSHVLPAPCCLRVPRAGVRILQALAPPASPPQCPLEGLLFSSWLRFFFLLVPLSSFHLLFLF